MATLGPNDLKQFALPANWDASLLAKLALAQGYTYEQLINDVAAGLSLQNAALVADPLIAGLISVTEERTVEYRVGVSNGFQRHTEYGRGDAGRGKTTGHMLPMWSWDRKLGWTWDFLRAARRSQIDADIASAMEDLRDIWHKTILTRHFQSTYDAVGSGKSVPFCDGGTADDTYIPIAKPERGGSFLATHSHFLRHSAITQANLELAVAHLWEHGHDGPYELLVAQADLGTWTDVTVVTGWIKRADGAIRYGNQVDLANVPGDYLGVVETKYGACRLRATGRVPTAYYSVYKSYGSLDQRNPLRVCQSPRYQIGAVLLAGDHIREFPLENAILFIEFGPGVGEDRTAAVCVEIDSSGDYGTPTIS